MLLFKHPDSPCSRCPALLSHDSKGARRGVFRNLRRPQFNPVRFTAELRRLTVGGHGVSVPNAFATDGEIPWLPADLRVPMGYKRVQAVDRFCFLAQGRQAAARSEGTSELQQ